MMKIAWLCPYPIELCADTIELMRPAQSHASSWIVNLSNALAELDALDLHLVTVSARVAGRQTKQLRPGLTLHVLRDAVPFTARGWPGKFPLDALSKFAIARRKLVKEVRIIGPDLVHGHGTEGPYALAAMDTGLPSAISIQGINARYFEVDRRFRRRVVVGWERDAVKKANNFFCRTQWDTEFVHSLNSRAAVFDVPEAMNPVFFEDAWKGSDSKIVLFIGSAGVLKGFTHLVSAVASIRRRIPDVKLIAAGRFPTTIQMRHYAEAERATGSTDWLRFVGFQTSVQLAQWHRAAGVFALPSLMENSPNSLAEAMVSGMPVIATRVGGIPSMITDEVDGILVPPADSEALAEMLECVLLDLSVARRLGESARATGERHRPTSVAARTIQCYSEILSRAY